MNTNQMMQIQIGNFGTLEIGHLTKMGKVSQVIEMGNKLRQTKDLREITQDELLKKQDLWEFIISRNTQKARESNSVDSTELKIFTNFDGKNTSSITSNFKELKNYKNSAGQIQYSQLMKKFPNLIKSKRGKNGGTWAELYILLKIASMLDKDLEVEIYQVFIEQKILFWRDLGGDNFKDFNKLVDTLPDRINKNNTGVYVAVAKMIRTKLEILDTKGYNEKEHNSLIQINRAEWLKNLSLFIENSFVNSYEELKRTFQKLKVIEKE
jgi:hypothetical protein